MKHSLVFVCAFLCISTIACSQPTSGFKSPEAVVNYFVQNLKNGNFENVIKTSAFNYDRIIDKIDAKEMGKRLMSIQLMTPFNVPKQYHSIIKLRALSQHAFNLQLLVSSLLLPEQFNDFLQAKPIMLSGNEQLLETYLSSLEDIKKLNSLEFIRMDISNPEIQFSDAYKNNIERQKITYGFDEQVEYTVLYKFNNQYYVGGFIFARYGIDWYISNYSAILANQSALGYLEKISGINEYLYEYDIKK